MRLPGTYISPAESGFYATGSRYYDPEIGRFINSDGYVSTGQGITGYNLFAYCGNNPVSRKDPIGTFWDTIFDVITLGASIIETISEPENVWNWARIAGDMLDLIPFVTGVGEAVRGAKVANKAVDVASTTQKGWKVGDEINALIRQGNQPSWSTVKSRYWKNEAHYNASSYSKDNIDLMKKGRAPLVKYEGNGKCYPMELHHIKPRREGGSNYFDNLLPVTPWDHDAMDEFRHFNPK